MSIPTSGTPKRPEGDGKSLLDEPQRSGEGAQTALQALIRKRKFAEHPADPEPEPPAPAQP
jgi:hypothetical protein